MVGGSEEMARRDRGGVLTATTSVGSTWLEAWHDPVADAKAFRNCVQTADLYGDGDWRLLIADFTRKLRVWKGTSLASEHVLLDQPVGIATFYSDMNQPRLPSVAVAAGANVYIYRNLRPYYKFTVPPMDISQQELEVWNGLKADKIDTVHAHATLASIRESGVEISTRSNDLLTIEDPAQLKEFLAQVKGQPLVEHTVITCIGTIKKGLDELDAVSCLILGTESRQVLVLDPGGQFVKRKVTLPSVPVLFSVSGLLDMEYRLLVACRDGNISILKNGDVSPALIELDSLPCGLVRTAKSIIFGCMNNTLQSYNVKGKKEWSLTMPAAILCIELISIQRQRMVKAVAVGLSNGEIRVYNEKNLVSVTNTQEKLTGLFFGRFGREDNTLISVSKSGALTVRILPRTATLEPAPSSATSGPETEVPLAIPKRTKVYLEQTQRERDQAAEMHRLFQKGLTKLRLDAARAYAKVLTDRQGAVSFAMGASMRLNAQVRGLGPAFKIRLDVQNTGARPILGITLACSYNAHIYELSRTNVQVPALLPHIVHTEEVPVTCLDPASGVVDMVKIFVCAKGSTLPILCALVKMPPSDMPFQT